MLPGSRFVNWSMMKEKIQLGDAGIVHVMCAGVIAALVLLPAVDHAISVFPVRTVVIGTLIAEAVLSLLMLFGRNYQRRRAIERKKAANLSAAIRASFSGEDHAAL